MDTFLGKAGVPLRNLARRRAAYHSSSTDYDHTAQLVTDGIIHMDADRRVRYTAQHPPADSPDREGLNSLFDGSVHTKYLTFHDTGWIQVRLPKANARRGVSGYLLTSADDEEGRDPAKWTLQGSDDGRHWKVLDVQENVYFCGRKRTRVFLLCRPAWYRYYRLNITGLRDPAARSRDGRPVMQLARFDLLDAANRTLLTDDLPPEHFDSTWCADASGGVPQYVYVDLGTDSAIEAVRLFWPDEDHATQYDIQISDDAERWETIYTEENGMGGVTVCRFPDPVRTRFVRLFCRRSGGDRYTLSEMEVYGTNVLVYTPEAQPQPEENGMQRLWGGNWRVERRSEVTACGEVLSTAGYADDDWLPATVPGTVLAAFQNAGAVPDWRIADHVFQISDRYFTADFWYRNHFYVPEEMAGKRVWLCFDAINWKADAYFNGRRLGNICGAFQRKRFDVTGQLRKGGENFLAVLIHAPDHPDRVDRKTQRYAGHNGGALVRDNPTITASVGWDWVPTLPGRDIGIYGDVYLACSGDVSIADPLVTTRLSAHNTRAALRIRAVLSNASDRPHHVVVSGTIEPSGTRFSRAFMLPAHSSGEEYTLADNVILENPRLWWPNSYGDQPLYTATLTMKGARTRKPSDELTFSFGVRELRFDDNGYEPAADLKNAKFPHSRGGPLALYCNGVHIICRGGNWGMDDANLTASPADYDAKVRLHAEANFTMIRNWVGMTANPAFYDACDKYGILIWQDFWLANPVDKEQGAPDDACNPDDEAMFLSNAEDTVRRIRRHPSVAVYCGRNEGPPPDSLNMALQELTDEWDGSRYYTAFSADNHLTGEGFVYGVQNPWYYFEESLERQNPRILQIERGFPNVPAYESALKMLTPQHAWPIDDVWGVHDFCGTDGGYSAADADGYVKKLTDWYGVCDDLRTFTRTAQMLNYEGMKALYEGMYHLGREGLLMWMSQSAWPSMIWQTYDYYYDTNGGYFGAKKGAAPLAAYWPNTQNEDRRYIFLRNYRATNYAALRVTLDVYNLRGERVFRTETTAPAPSGQATPVLKLPDLSEQNTVFFFKIAVFEGETQMADNFYWMNPHTNQNYHVLRDMPSISLLAYAKRSMPEGEEDAYTVVVQNPTDTPALAVRLKTMDADTGAQILPVYYSDNYFALMPGEKRTISLAADRRFGGGQPRFEVEGWNVTASAVQIVSGK